MPLPIEKLKAVKTIITHKGCADGVAAAILLHDVLPDAEIRFIQYGTDERRDLKPQHHMLFCDFSPNPKNYQPFIEADALILDHHAGEKAMVAEFGQNGVFGDEIQNPYDCGGSLAYREVWLRLQTPEQVASKRSAFAQELARLTAIRDTWKNKDPDWSKACAVAETLRFYPEESWLTHDPFGAANKGWWDARLQIGEMLFERNCRTVNRAVEGAYRFTTAKGTRVVLFSGTRLSSDAADVVDQDADLVVGFDYMGIESGLASLVYSNRSHTGFNCMTFAKAHGGGGHTAAAGFSMKFDPKEAALDPYTTYERLLNKYEAA